MLTYYYLSGGHILDKNGSMDSSELCQIARDRNGEA
jgi:hypothetical protein